MQILASALPGFRDLRAPLIAGYLWLILLWIWLTPDLKTRPANEISAALWDLGKAAGPVWVALSVSVTAYLVGSVSQTISAPLARVGSAILPLLTATFGPRKHGLPLPTSSSPIFDPITEHYERGLTKIGNPEISITGSPTASSPRQLAELRRLDQKVESARNSLRLEVELPATLLIGKEPELFTEADRLKAESQLRIAIVAPLAAITGYVSYNLGWLWLLLLIPILVLFLQGARKDLEFKSLMSSAFQQGLVRSQTLESFKQWIDDLPTIRGQGGTSVREP